MFEYISKFRNHSRLHGYRNTVKKSYKKLLELRACRSATLENKSGISQKAYSANRLGNLLYRCNICGIGCETKMADLKREEPSCHNCGSTVRMRAMVHTLSMELFGESLAIPDFPVRKDIAGIGMSDWIGYAIPLAQKLAYRNTFYHQEPKVDMTSIDSALEGTLDFIISSDVFEHIEPPVSRAFENARRLLKPEGVLIFSVPYIKGDNMKEHFPDLYKYEIVKGEKGFVLQNTTRSGVYQTYDNLIFHGGEGATLEMRCFAEDALIEEFWKAGFGNVKVYRESCFEHGIYWDVDWALPIAGRIK